MVPLKLTEWLWICYKKIPIYPICYLRKGDCKPKQKDLLQWSCQIKSPRPEDEAASECPKETPKEARKFL